MEPLQPGSREDKRAEKIHLEKPRSVSLSTVTPPSHLPIPLTHPDRVLYPEGNVTKQELAEYYLSVAERMLPYVKNRLLTVVRCPSGQGKPCFYQKHAKEGLPNAISAHRLDSTGSDRFVYVSDAAGLVALVQIGVLEIHTWGSRIDRLERPDQLVFDLDPDPALDWVRLVEGALDVRDELKRAGLKSFVKTTGGKGLHGEDLH